MKDNRIHQPSDFKTYFTYIKTNKVTGYLVKKPENDDAKRYVHKQKYTRLHFFGLGFYKWKCWEDSQF